MFVAHHPTARPIPNEPDPSGSHALQELREFVAGHGAAVDADPAFRERLREQLWALVSRRHSERTTTS